MLTIYHESFAHELPKYFEKTEFENLTIVMSRGYHLKVVPFPWIGIEGSPVGLLA